MSKSRCTRTVFYGGGAQGGCTTLRTSPKNDFDTALNVNSSVTGRRSQAADCDLKLVPCTMIEFTKLLLPERRYSSGCHQLLLQYSCGRECCPRRSRWRHRSCLGQPPFLRYFSRL